MVNIFLKIFIQKRFQLYFFFHVVSKSLIHLWRFLLTRCSLLLWWHWEGSQTFIKAPTEITQNKFFYLLDLFYNLFILFLFIVLLTYVRVSLQKHFSLQSPCNHFFITLLLNLYLFKLSLKSFIDFWRLYRILLNILGHLFSLRYRQRTLNILPCASRYKTGRLLLTLVTRGLIPLMVL